MGFVIKNDTGVLVARTNTGGITIEMTDEHQNLRRQLSQLEGIRKTLVTRCDELMAQRDELKEDLGQGAVNRIADLKRQLEMAQRSEHEACERNQGIVDENVRLKRKLDRIRSDLDH